MRALRLAAARPLAAGRRGWRWHAALATAAPSSAAAPPVLAAALDSRERSASISVHKGHRIQAALCVERPPSEVLEPEFKKRWREFKKAWQGKTGNDLTVAEELVFMRFHFHFFGDSIATQMLAGERTPARVGGGGGRASSTRRLAEGTREGELAKALAAIPGATATALDDLMANEGLDPALLPRRRKQTGPAQQQKQATQERRGDDGGVRSLRRLPGRSLFLLVKYGGGGGWTFPKADRAHGQAMREGLLRLCARQLGEGFEPYVVGACPFSHRKLRSERHPGLQGRKIFYYRARLPPDMDVAPPVDSPVMDWAWLSRPELPDYLGTGEWVSVRDGLPLDHVEL